MKHFLKQTIVMLGCLFTTIGNAQSLHQPSLNLSVGALVTASPDSIYKLQANAFVGDSIAVNSIRLVVSDSVSIYFDQQYVLNTLPTSGTIGAWKNDYTVFIDLPNYNPFQRKRYLLELLGTNGQLLMQLEKEF